MQANVRLRRRDNDVARSADALFRGLREVLDDWDARGVVSTFFFVRKRPDVRLRFETGGSASSEREIHAFFDAAVVRRTVTRWVVAAYEPDVHLFGGPSVMRLVHRHFDADARAWMEWRELKPAAALASRVLSLAVLNDLFFRAVEGAEEAWDIWCNVATLHGSSVGGAAQYAGRETWTPIRPLDLMGMVGRPERRLLRAYVRANRALARGLNRLEGRGELRCGRRALLAFVALFHWNRFGFTVEQRAEIFTPMMRALDPRRGLRGAGIVEPSHFQTV